MAVFHNMLKAKEVCEEGTWGAQIYEGLELDPVNRDVVVAKHWNARWVPNTLHLLRKIENCRSSNY